jgi:hypothetical protein
MESIVGVQTGQWVVLPQTMTTAMFAPQSAAEPVLAVVLHPVHHRNAVAKVEIAGPATQHLVDLPNHLLDGTPQRPVVEDFPQLLT